MEESIKELEEKLRLARIKEEEKRILDMYSREKIHEGKCFSNFSLNKAFGKYKTTSFNIRRFKRVYLFDSEHYEEVSLENLFEYLRNAFKTNIYPKCEYEEIYIYKRNELSDYDITIRHYESVDLSKSVYEGLTYEISLEKYNKLKNFILKSVDISLLNVSKEDIKIDYNKCEEETKQLKDLGVSLVELSDSETYELTRRNCPFLYGNSLVKNDLSRALINKYLDEEKKKDALDVDFYCHGEYIPRSGYYARIIEKLNSILNKL